MPTLYDNFERVKNYVDEQIAASGSGEVDLSSYVTKAELSNAGYITAVPSEYVTQTELSANSYATTTQLSSYLPLSGGTLTGNLTLGNTYFLTVGTQRAWKLFEDGSGSGAYIALQAGVDSKNFYIRDMAGNNLVQIYESSTNTAKSFITNFTVNTYTNNIIPRTNNTYNLGSSTARFASTYTDVAYITNNNKMRDVTNAGWYFSRNNTDIFKVMAGTNNIGISPSSNNSRYLGSSEEQWAYTYTRNLILNGTDINQPLSVGKIHYGTAVHNRTTYTTTCTVDTFETDSNGNPLPGTMIAVKLTSITGTNPATLYTVKFIVNEKENNRWYGQSAQTSFGNGRNWYRDMNDGTNRYWYWFWDGNYWVWQGISDERDTTYSAMSDAEASAGTSTSGRLIKPVTLATYYTAKSCFSFDSSTNTLTITTT